MCQLGQNGHSGIFVLHPSAPEDENGVGRAIGKSARGLEPGSARPFPGDLSAYVSQLRPTATEKGPTREDFGLHR